MCTIKVLLITVVFYQLVIAQKIKYDIRKCCGITEVLKEDAPGLRECVAVENIGVIGLNSRRWQGLDLKHYAINHGRPTCQEREQLIPIYYHVRDENHLNLTENGTLEYSSIIRKNPVHLSYLKYCIDTVVISHNYSHIDQGDTPDFAFICLDISRSISDVVNYWVFPIGIGVSMGCLVLTFVFYFVLPQLRDLTGRFILGICAFLTANYAIRLVEAYGLYDIQANGLYDVDVDKLAIEFVEHGCMLGAWLSLNSMGHHVWKVIMADSVFTRVTDKKRCCYYSFYVLAVTTVVSCTAVTVHFTVEEELLPGYVLGYITLGIFYVPVALLLLVNLFFYWNCNQQIGKQLVYNRSMQHFQINHDLYSKLLMIMSSCSLFQTLGLLDISALYYIGIVFSILQGPLIFVICMCRTRVAYLIRKYFCKTSCSPCCSGNGDFIELASTELATIDKLRDAADLSLEPEANKSLLDRWGDAASSYKDNPRSKDKEMSKSLVNVKEKAKEGSETPLMKMGRLLKTNSVNLATLNFGWRRETCV